MKGNLIILLLFSFTTSTGQETVQDILDRMPQGRKGIKQYTEAIKLDSNNAEAYWRRGYEYYRTNKFNSAISDFNKAITKDSLFNHAVVLADRGLSKEMLGMFDDAIVDFSSAIAYSYTQDTTIPQGLEKYYYHRGRTKFKLGDTINAILDLDSSLIFWNFHYYARKLRATLLAMSEQYPKALNDYLFLLTKWQGGGMDFSTTKEYAIDYYWRGKTKQAVGRDDYLEDLRMAEKLKYRKFKPTDLRGL